MSRKYDLEQSIRESYNDIRYYETVLQDSERPEEKRRARRRIQEQWKLIEDYLADYLPICRHLGASIPEDIRQLTARFPDLRRQFSTTSGSDSQHVSSVTDQPPLAPDPALSVAAATGTFSDAYALIIGIGAYHHMRPLTKATADALDLHDLLAQIGYPTANLALLLDEQATKAAISDKLDWLARCTDPHNTVIIFFSGHGTHRIGGFEPGEYLCPVEADWYNLRITAISDQELTSALRAIPARRAVVFLDACHAGGVGEPKDSNLTVKPGLSETAYEKLATGEGRVVIASCKPDEASWEFAGMRNSLFTNYLLEALRGGAAVRGDGYVRIYDLAHYVQEKVPQRQPNQHPIFKGADIDANFSIALVEG